MITVRGRFQKRRGRRSLPTGADFAVSRYARQPSAAPGRTRSMPTAATSRILPPTRPSLRSVANAATNDLRALPRRSRRARFVSNHGGARLSAIRQFYRFLYAEGRRKHDPAAILEGPKRTRPRPKMLTLAELDRLLGVAGQTGSGGAVVGAAAKCPARLSCRASLRHRPARFRTCVAAGFSRTTRCSGHCSCVQRATRNGAGAAQQCRQARDRRLPRASVRSAR